MEQNKARCWAAVLLHDISPQQQRPWSQHVRNKATRWTSEPQQEVWLFVDLWTGNTQQVLISNRVQIQTFVYQHLYIWAHRELSWTHTSVLHQTQHTYTLFPPAAAQSSLYSQGGLLIWKAPHRKFQRNRRRTKGWSVMLRLGWSASAGNMKHIKHVRKKQQQLTRLPQPHTVLWEQRGLHLWNTQTQTHKLTDWLLIDWFSEISN